MLAFSSGPAVGAPETVSSFRFLVQHCLEQDRWGIIEVHQSASYEEIVMAVLTNNGKFSAVDDLAVEAFDPEFMVYVAGKTMALLLASRRLRVIRPQAPAVLPPLPALVIPLSPPKPAAAPPPAHTMPPPAPSPLPAGRREFRAPATLSISQEEMTEARRSLPRNAELSVTNIMLQLVGTSKPGLARIILVALARRNMLPTGPPTHEGSESTDHPPLLKLAASYLRLNQMWFPTNCNVSRAFMHKLLTQLSGTREAEAVLQALAERFGVLVCTRRGVTFLKANNLGPFTNGIIWPKKSVVKNRHVNTPAVMLALCVVLDSAGWKRICWKDLFLMMSLLSLPTPKMAATMHKELKFLVVHGLLENVAPDTVAVTQKAMSSSSRNVRPPELSNWDRPETVPQGVASNAASAVQPLVQTAAEGPSWNGVAVDLKGLDRDAVLLLTVISSLHGKDGEWPDRERALAEIQARDARFKYIGMWNDAWDTLKERNIITGGKPRITLWSAEGAAAAAAAAAQDELEKRMLGAIRAAATKAQTSVPLKADVMAALNSYDEKRFSRKVQATVLGALKRKGDVGETYCQQTNQNRLRILSDPYRDLRSVAQSVPTQEGSGSTKNGTGWVRTAARSTMAWGSPRAPPARLGGGPSQKPWRASGTTTRTEPTTTMAVPTGSTPKRLRDEEGEVKPVNAAPHQAMTSANTARRHDGDEESLPQRRSRNETWL